MSVASQPSRISSGAPPVDDELDLAALGSALWRNKRNILIAAGAVALFTLVIVQLITPKYFSEARVLIEQHDNVYMRPDADKEVNNGTEVDEQAVISQAQIIMSRDLALEVIKKLKLNELPEFDPALAGISPVRAILGLLGLIRNPMSMTPEERVLESYYDRLTVSPVEKSRVITIDFLSQNPELAARVANAIAEAYLDRQRGAKQDQAKTAAAYLAGQIETMRKKVAEADAKAEAFRAKSGNLLVGTNNTTLSAQQLGDFNGQLSVTRAQKADAEAKAKMIRNMLHSGQTLESSDILNSELFRRLSEQRVTLRAQLAEQSSTLLDGHPRIKELRAQIADLDRQISEEAERIARSLENDAKLADARMNAQLAALDELKSQASTTNGQDVQLRSLEMDAKSQRDLLESYLAKYREAAARDTLDSAPADARVISRATVSNIPFYPKKLPTVLIATLTTLVLGAGFVVTTELLAEPTAVRPRQPKRRDDSATLRGLGARLASHFGFGSRAAPEVPALDVLQSRMAAVVGAPAPKDTSHSVGVPISAIEDVAYNLREAGAAGARVAVFGAMPGSDAGRSALRLARCLAEDARVVLVGLSSADAAIRAASNDPSASGLAELGDDTASFRDIITKDWQTRLHLISSGRALADRPAILSAPGMETNLLALARSYDHVVFDAGAASGSDLRDVSEIAPHAILVIAGSVANAVMAAARERLLAAGFDDVTVMIAARAASASVRAEAA